MGKNILVVDDSLFILKQLSSILEEGGYKVYDTALNGQECISKYRANRSHIDLITLDITMPVLDGITTLQRLMEYDSSVKVVMASALSSPQMVKQALMLGAKNYIVKPLNKEKVLSRIHALI